MKALAAGVALLEVIVALVIVSTFGAALFTWSAQTYRAASRAVDLLEAAELERNALELSQALNPARMPHGKLQTEACIYEWSSQLVRPATDHVKHPAGVSPYQVGLYKVSVKVFRRSDPSVAMQRDYQAAGHSQVRVRPSGMPGSVAP